MASAVDELRRCLTLPPASLPVAQHRNPVAVAHAALQQLRDAGDPAHLFLRCILEWTAGASAAQQHPQPINEELLFHCLAGCRQVVLWQWTATYSVAFVETLRDYLLVVGFSSNSLAHHQQDLPRTCRLACFTTVAALWKRGWDSDNSNNSNNNPTTNNNTNPQEQALIAAMTSSPMLGPLPGLRTQHDLWRYLDSLFAASPSTQTIHACALVEALTAEFGGPTAVSYRLPLEFHKRCHRSFQRSGALQHVVNLTTTALRHVALSTLQQQQQHFHNETLALQQAVVQAVSSVLGWEFGLSAWDPGTMGAAALASSRTMIRAPMEWKESVVGGSGGDNQPILIDLIFQLYQKQQQQTLQHNNNHQGQQLLHNLRQLLLQLASLSGPVVANTPDEKRHYAARVCEGTLPLLQSAVTPHIQAETSDLPDAIQLVARLVANFRLSLLTTIPVVATILQHLTAAGRQLLQGQLRDCEAAHGDVESMEHREWRDDVLQSLLECAVLVCGDAWLRYHGTAAQHRDQQQQQQQQQLVAQRSLMDMVGGPLFEGFVQCRTRMAALEEYYLVTHEEDFDEVRDEIMEAGLEEEMESLSTLGRLHLASALSCLSSLFGTTLPRLQGIWGNNDTNGNVVTPEASALLEEARLLIMYVSHLLTDNNEGESPSIPDAVLLSCRDNEALVGDLSAAVQTLLQLANLQSQAIAKEPNNRRLSPLLATSFLWFSNRWVPSYVYPVDYRQSGTANRLVKEWSTPETASQIISLCINLCVTYQCYWPQEKTVQASVSKLLLSLARRGDKVRPLMVASPVFHDMVRYHCWTAGLRHSAPQAELETAIRSKTGGNGLPNMNMVWGYHRLPYQDKAQVLTAILVACSDTSDETENSMINGALGAVHDAFTSLVNALASKQIDAEDVDAREMACLCVEMLCGVVQASEMSSPERIPQLMSGYLPQLSGLMNYYANDLTVCYLLLRLFQDFTANFISLLNREQSLVLFQASAELLKSYSANHIAARAIKKKSATEAEAEEEQAYNDILCAIRLLINLGTKDFIDSCSSEGGVDSSQVTDVIFFGLQQILPLMSAGLLQFPSLCSVFFDLVAFMMETYPNKVCILPYDLFDSLLEALLFGMSHSDANIAKSSLHGLASIAREHITTGVLQPHLQQHPDIFDRCSRRLLSEVVFQTVVVDRMEAASMALLPLAAVDLNRFAAVVQELSSRVADLQHRARLQAAFSKLIQPQALSDVTVGGYEGRLNRVKFRGDFEDFVGEVHAFLVLQ